MLDKRYKHSLRVVSPFYLYKKYKESGIFYVRFHDGKTISTRTTNIEEAYRFAIEIADRHKVGIRNYLRSCKGNDYERNRLINLLDFDDFSLLTKPKLYELQEKLLDCGLSGKSVNNNISIFHSLVKPLVKNGTIINDPFIGLEKVEHNKQIRKCLPVSAFKGFDWNKDKYSLLAYAAITTGARRGELMRIEEKDIQPKNDYFVLHIRGTKTCYSDRYVPINNKTKDCLIEIIRNKLAVDNNIRDTANIIGQRLGFSERYLIDNGICFHSYRKMFKTILTSANLNTTLIETLMGHTTNNQASNDVERIYFVTESADLDDVYKLVVDTMTNKV